jgi:hypothetical protein
MKLVYIMGLEHSGTTLLNFMLGANSKAAGTGEGLRFFDQREDFINKNALCTCGEHYADCPFWSFFETKFKESGDKSEDNFLRVFLDSCNDFYGSGNLIVDSSKDTRILERAAEYGDLDIKVVVIVKDVRAWGFSVRSKAKKKGTYSFLKHNYPYLFRSWHKSNRNLEKRLKALGLDYLTITYEDLCFSPADILEELCDFAGLKYEEQMARPDRSQQHYINGNRMRVAEKGEIEVSYDSRWFFSLKWVPAAMLMRRVMSYNAAIHKAKTDD